jgi:hypothetical protein
MIIIAKLLIFRSETARYRPGTYLIKKMGSPAFFEPKRKEPIID